MREVASTLPLHRLLDGGKCPTGMVMVIEESNRQRRGKPIQAALLWKDVAAWVEKDTSL